MAVIKQARVLKLRALRIERKMTLADLGGRVGLGVSTICEVEYGKRDLMLKHAKKIAAVLGTTVDQAFAFEEHSKAS